MNVGLIAGQNIGSGKISYVSASGTINVGLKDTGSGTGDRTLTPKCWWIVWSKFWNYY